MKVGVLLKASLGLLVVPFVGAAEPEWPVFMPTLMPGLSAGLTTASIPTDVRVDASGSEVPIAKAKGSGRWEGYGCRDA